MYATCLLAFLALPAAASAATPGDSAKVKPRPLYVGVQAAAFRYSGFGQTDGNGRRLSYRGVMPVIGWHIDKRSSIEVTAMWHRPTDGNITEDIYPDGSKYRYYDRYQSRVIPILYRYSLLAHPRQWNVEGVAGFSLLHSRTEGRRSMTRAGQPEQPYEVGGFSEANDLPLTLGAAVTYAPNQRWTVVGEGRMNWSVLGSIAGAVLLGGVYLPQPGASVGLRYNFGLGL